MYSFAKRMGFYSLCKKVVKEFLGSGTPDSDVMGWVKAWRLVL